jgi:hypothetical protein
MEGYAALYSNLDEPAFAAVPATSLSLSSSVNGTRMSGDIGLGSRGTSIAEVLLGLIAFIFERESIFVSAACAAIFASRTTSEIYDV